MVAISKAIPLGRRPLTNQAFSWKWLGGIRPILTPRLLSLNYPITYLDNDPPTLANICTMMAGTKLPVLSR